MRLTRQVQFWKRDEPDWDTPIVVENFRWEDPDVVILDPTGNELRRVRIGALETYIGWLGRIVWVAD